MNMKRDRYICTKESARLDPAAVGGGVAQYGNCPEQINMATKMTHSGVGVPEDWNAFCRMPLRRFS